MPGCLPDDFCIHPGCFPGQFRRFKRSLARNFSLLSGPLGFFTHGLVFKPLKRFLLTLRGFFAKRIRRCKH